VANFRSKRDALQFSGLLEAFLPYFHQAFLRVAGISGGQETMAEPLTTREREALLWLIDGKNNHEIGQLMLISERTVKFYVRNLMKKLNAHNRFQLVANAFNKHSDLAH
jgi:DNA-binding NarL/FixJ family response regulator